MKKILVILISLILVGLSVWGVVAWAQSCQGKDVNSKTFHCMYLDKEYAEDDTIVFRVVYFSDVEITSVKYTLDNGAETATTVVTGNAEDHELYEGKGKYYVDTKVELINSDTLSAGNHLVEFYGYDGEDTRYILNKDYIVFKVVAQQNAG